METSIHVNRTEDNRISNLQTAIPMPKEITRRFIRNASMILGSRLVFGLLNVATSILTVRIFGLTDYGVVLLLQSYTRLFNDIIKFDSWQAVLTYGARLQENRDIRGLRQLFGLFISVDIASMATGVILAILFVPYAAEIFEWPPEVARFAPFYVLSVFFMAHATPNGILRLFDRVDVLAVEFAIKAVARLAGVGLVAWMGGNVFHLVLVWFGSTILAGSWPIAICIREMYTRGLMPIFRINWIKAGKRFKGVWRFLAFANASTTIGFVNTTGTTLFTGLVLGAAPAAIFEISHQVAAAISRPVRLLGPIISPEFAMLAAKGDWLNFRKVISRQLRITGSVLFAVAIILFPLLGFILEAIYGPEVVKEIWLFRLYIAAILLAMATFTFEPAILSAGKAGTLLAIRASATALYAMIVLLFLQEYGLTVIGIAALTLQLVFFVSFMFFGKKLLKKRVRRVRNASNPPA